MGHDSIFIDFFFIQGKDSESLQILNEIYRENNGNDENKKFSVKKLIPELNEDYQKLKVMKGV